MEMTLASFDDARHAMVVSQLRTSAVNDPRVVQAMATVARERFVPEAVRATAYRDRLLPLANGRLMNAPLPTGRLLTEAQLRPDDKVLLIGAAAGYAAALLSRLVAHVVAVESDAALAADARAALDGDARVTLVEGPLSAGAPADAPYDVLMIDGAVPAIPDSLTEQLRPGARVVTGLVDRGVTRLASGERTEGGLGLFDFTDCECVILPGFEAPKGFSF